MARLQATPIHLSELQRELLEQQVNRHQLSEQLRVRIQTILKASQGASNNSLMREYSPGNYHLVKKWRDRWAAKQEALQELEAFVQGKRGMKKRLLEAMLALLQDAGGRGVSSTFTAAQEELIIAMACKKPCDYGLADNNWTQSLLAKIAVREGIVDSISQSKICTILKKRTSTP
jgi:putative transposase